jgi:uncharacterized membrane protein YcjF (UPF0283 family)
LIDLRGILGGAMSICEVCGKEMVGNEQPMRLYAAQILGRAINKLGVTSSTMSQYKNFRPVEVAVCSRHRRMLTVQRINAGTIALIVVFIAVLTLLSFIADWNKIGASYLYLLALGVAFIPVVLLARLITYERLVVRMLNITRKTREAKMEYFTQGQVQKIMARLANSKPNPDQEAE